MIRTIWSGGSLRAWIGAGMAIAVLPLALSAIAAYTILSRGVVASFQDVAFRQREELGPIQQLCVLVLSAAAPIDSFVDEGSSDQPAKYQRLRSRIDSVFTALMNGIPDDHALKADITSAHRDWRLADSDAEAILSARWAPGDQDAAGLMDRFHDLADSVVTRLQAAYDIEAADVRSDHDVAIRDFKESEWFSLVAGVGSLGAIALGIFIIGRVMSASVERLVSGAELFASGDRDHRIDISVPPELHRVAEEFNRMIGRIHASEDALADLARRDSLTQLLNRRAFDEALNEAMARRERLGESFGVLMFDIDNFKRVNDTYGHSAGDDVLRWTAQALTAALRPFDSAYRVGGEEFAVILAAIDVAGLRTTSERLRSGIADGTIAIGVTSLSITVSIGAVIAASGTTAASLIAAADGALYEAKHAGRNRVVFGSTDHAGQAAPKIGPVEPG